MTTKEKIFEKISASYSDIVRCYGNEEIAHEAIMYMINHADQCAAYNVAGEGLKKIIMPIINKKEKDKQQPHMSAVDINADDAAILLTMCEQLMGTVNRVLTERQARIVKYRFGFDEGGIRTLKECGSLFNTSSECIRVIEAKALHRLRNCRDRTQMLQLLQLFEEIF